MKALKSALLISALAAMVALSGCTACDNTSSSSASSSRPSSSSSSSLASDEDSVLPSESGSSGLDDSSSSSMADNTSSMVPTVSTDFGEIGALPADPVTWGPGRQMDDRNRSTACLDLQEKYGKYGCYFIGSEPGAIYLTFDEGYENGFTPAILDVLKEKQVQAVFFVTGDYVKREPELVRRMIDEGHIVGNHSWSHPSGDTGFNFMPLDAVQADIMKLHDYVKENFDYDMFLFRFPEGTFTERNAALLGQMGYRTLFWSFAYADWNRDEQPDPAAALTKTVGAAHDGGIYLLHAVSKTNAEILPQFIDQVRAKGYQFALFQEGGQQPAE